jgi:hypothetical protein
MGPTRPGDGRDLPGDVGVPLRAEIEDEGSDLTRLGKPVHGDQARTGSHVSARERLVDGGVRDADAHHVGEHAAAGPLRGRARDELGGVIGERIREGVRAAAELHPDARADHDAAVAAVRHRGSEGAHDHVVREGADADRANEGIHVESLEFGGCSHGCEADEGVAGLHTAVAASNATACSRPVARHGLDAGMGAGETFDCCPLRW